MWSFLSDYQGTMVQHLPSLLNVVGGPTTFFKKKWE
jgi:hypothetical protein